MRKMLRLFVFNVIGFVLIAYLISAIQYSQNMEVLVRAAGIYALLSMFIKPLLSLLALPINFFTFGMFSSVVNVVILYMVGRIESGFSIVPYRFPGIFYQGFIIPHVDLGIFMTSVLVSLMISFAVSFLLWLSD